MRASNGVIVITTKSGKGAAKGKPTITLNTNLSFEKVSTLPEFQKEYAQGANGVYSPYASTAWGPKIADLANDAPMEVIRIMPILSNMANMKECIMCLNVQLRG